MKNLKVKFDSNGCLVVPKVKVNLVNNAKNSDLLHTIGAIGREAQTPLDRIAISNIEACLLPDTPEDEKALFKEIEKLNAEIVLRILTMRRLAVEGLIR
jgi:hypothetical protein